MPAAGRYFITPHAVHRYVERVMPGLTYEQALGDMINALERTTSSPKRLRDGMLRVRVRKPRDWFALVSDRGPGLPQVVTVMRSGHGRRA